MNLKLLTPLLAALILPRTLVSADDISPNRFHSPSGHYDVLFEPLADDWTHAQKGKAGLFKDAMQQYAIVFSVAGSTASLNAVYFSDSGTRPPPARVYELFHWSPQENFVLFQDRPQASIAPHVFQHVASLKSEKSWDFEANHVHWLDDHRVVGDVNSKEVPGGIVIFDGNAGTADLVIPPVQGIGYQVASVSGHVITVNEILNNLGNDKTSWEHFTPACFTFNTDTLKKNSVPCPK